MKSQYRELIKHSAVYGAGQVLTRLVSVLLLPLYTHYLRPADYGAFAILDLTANVMSILIGAGMAAAANRYHFEADTPDRKNAVWWTSLAVVALVATGTIAPAFVLRHALATVTLGAQETSGSFWWALLLPTLWFGTVAQVPSQYLRVRKWSTLSVALSVGGLLLNIGLNVYFLTVRHMGVAGMLMGNLITAAATATAFAVIMAAHCGRPRFEQPLAAHLWHFGSPMVVTALLSMVMHQADRLILRMFFNLDSVGIYSLAYTIGQGVNTLILLPFSSIWAVVIYDIAAESHAKRTYALVFEYFVYGLLLILFGVCLFITPVLGYLVPGEYAGVGRIVPVVCLAFVFFSLHEHFKVPALLTKRTVSLLGPYAIAAAANVALNFLVIPYFGTMGAAWTSLATYAIFSGVGLLAYRRIDRIAYPLARCALVLLAMSVSYGLCEALQTLTLPIAWKLAVPAVVWIAWAVLLFRPLLKYVSPLRALAAVS